MTNNRDKIIYKNSIYNYIGRLIYYVISFIAVPLALTYMGKERFGIFQIILTFLSWASIANLGVGNGLRNKISEYLGNNRENEIRGVIGTAFSIALTISLILLVTGCSFIWFIFEPEWIISNTSISNYEIKLTFLLSFTFFCINLVFSLFSSIAYGIHKSYLTTIVQVVQYAIYCLLLYAFIKTNQKSFLVYVSIIYGLSTIFSQVVPFFTIAKNKDLWPPNFSNHKTYTKELLNISLGFFILQLSSIILFSSDNIILSKLLGPEEVAEYSIAYKLFFLVITSFSIILIQVWNSTTDALAKKDFDWIKRTVKKLHLILIPIFLGTILISLCLNYIVKIWIGETFNYSWQFRFIFSLYTLVHCSSAIFTNILNGAGRLKIQTIACVISSIINFMLSYFFIEILNLGLVGILYSKLICVSIITFMCFYDYKRFIQKFNR
jgi:O-antigen/teichoic acid export membrane protein